MSAPAHQDPLLALAPTTQKLLLVYQTYAPHHAQAALLHKLTAGFCDRSTLELDTMIADELVCGLTTAEWPAPSLEDDPP